MTDAVFSIDSDWRFLEINEQAEQSLDVDAETVIGESIWDIFPTAVDTRFYEAFRSVMNEREPVPFDERFDEMEMWFEVNVYPEPHGGISVYLQDITEQKGRENRIERLNR